MKHFNEFINLLFIYLELLTCDEAQQFFQDILSYIILLIIKYILLYFFDLVLQLNKIMKDYDSLNLKYNEIFQDNNNLKIQYNKISTKYNKISTKYNEISTKYNEINDNFKCLNYNIKEDKLLDIINIENQVIFINQKIIELNERLNKIKSEYLINNIDIQITKILNIFIFLNNIRLLLYSRKYINALLRYEIKNNKNLRVSKIKYLIDFEGIKYINDKKAINNYICNFVVSIPDEEENTIINKKHNLTLDFIYFLKNDFNNNIHIVAPIKNLNYNSMFLKIFSKVDSKNSSKEEEEIKKDFKENNLEIKEKYNKNPEENLKNTTNENNGNIIIDNKEEIIKSEQKDKIKNEIKDDDKKLEEEKDNPKSKEEKSKKIKDNRHANDVADSKKKKFRKFKT